MAQVTNSSASKRKAYASDEQLLRQAVETSDTILEVLEKLGYSRSSQNRAQVKKWAELYKIELPVFRKSHEELFAVGSKASRSFLKKKLRELGYEFKCRDCEIGEEWNGKPLSLQLEHINGINNDNRIENLTLLCPNCHSQTDTFAGRNKGVRSNTRID